MDYTSVGRIKIGVIVPLPHHGRALLETQKSVNLLVNSKLVNADLISVRGSSISTNRNLGCKNANRYDFVLMVDGDIQFQTEDVLKLVSANLDIVSGFYKSRFHKNKSVAGYIRKIGVPFEFLSSFETGIKEVDWVGMGFCLIKSEVFKKLKKPWFYEGVHFYDTPYETHKMESFGEDIGFCINAREHGFKVYVDCDCKVNHILESPFNQLYSEGGVIPVMDMRNSLNGKIEYLKGQINQCNSEISNLNNQIAEAQKKIQELNVVGQRFIGQIQGFETLLQELDKGEESNSALVTTAPDTEVTESDS